MPSVSSPRSARSVLYLLGFGLGFLAIAGAAPRRGSELPGRRLVRAATERTAVEQSGRSATTPRVKRDENGRLVPDVRAEAAIIYNPIRGEVVWEQNAHEPRSIASITKVMTAVVFLESNPDLTESVSIAREDVRRASTTYLRYPERATVNDLLHLALIASDNGAARALARISPWGSEGFIERMNEKAIELGLVDTSFADPSGLDADNLSSAFDLSRLIVYAAGHELIATIMQKEEYRIRTNRRRVRIRNTNKLLGDDLDVWGGKTGFIRKAGYCLAALLQLPRGGPVAVVVLGTRSNSARFLETRRLLSWLTTQLAE